MAWGAMGQLSAMHMAWSWGPCSGTTVVGGLQRWLKSLSSAVATTVMSSLATPKEAAAVPTWVMK